jgi:hypothetical protein
MELFTLDNGRCYLPLHTFRKACFLFIQNLSTLIFYFGGIYQQSKQNGKGEITFPVGKKYVSTLLYMASFPARENCLRDFIFSKKLSLSQIQNKKTRYIPGTALTILMNYDLSDHPSLGGIIKWTTFRSTRGTGSMACHMVSGFHFSRVFIFS